jgi:hypothetical protein
MTPAPRGASPQPGRNECASTAKAISAAAEDVSLDGCPAMLSTVSLNAALPIIAPPTAVGLDRTLRTCVRGAAAMRPRARANAPIAISVSRVECSLPTPNTLATARWRASLRIRNRIIASPTRSLSGLTCLRLLGVADRRLGARSRRHYLADSAHGVRRRQDDSRLDATSRVCCPARSGTRRPAQTYCTAQKCRRRPSDDQGSPLRQKQLS